MGQEIDIDHTIRNNPSL